VLAWLTREQARERVGQCGTRKLTMWWWQERFLRAGVDGLLRQDAPLASRRGPRANGCLDARFDWTVTGQCMVRHRHRNSSASSTAVPTGKLVHAMLDNRSRPQACPVLAWLINTPLRFMGDALERLNTVVDFELFRADLERAVPRLALRVSVRRRAR